MSEFPGHNPACSGTPVDVKAVGVDETYFHCYAEKCGYWKIFHKDGTVKEINAVAEEGAE